MFLKKLEYLMKLKSIDNLCELSKLCNVPYSTLRGFYSRGTKKLQSKTVKKIADFFDCSVEYFINDDVPIENIIHSFNIHFNIHFNDELNYAPLFNDIRDSVSINLADDILCYEEIPNWLTDYSEYFGLKITNNSMYPDYKEEDIVIFEKTDVYNDANDCIVLINNDGFFRRIFKSNDGIILEPLNTSYKAIYYSNEQIKKIPITIMGVAKQIRREII